MPTMNRNFAPQKRSFAGSKLNTRPPAATKREGKLLDAFIYDDILVGTTAAEYSLFVVPRGSGVSPIIGGSAVKTWIDTSQGLAGQNANKTAFEVLGMGFSCTPNATPASAATILADSWARFSIDDNDVWTSGPLWLWPGGAGFAGFAATTVAATTVAYLSNGLPSAQARKRLVNTFTVGGGAAWSVLVKNEVAPAAAAVLYCILDTKLVRGN